jgi:hypothetical protein
MFHPNVRVVAVLGIALTLVVVVPRRLGSKRGGENDVPRVRVGQKALFWHDRFPDRRFPGTVVRTVPVMGRQSVISGNPADKSDRDVLQVIVVPNPEVKTEVLARFPIGLRLTVRFDAESVP